MDPAHPIQNSKQDKFERMTFARHLAGFLTLERNAPSIVVGIESKWGEGKTSCINLVKEVLGSVSPRPIVVEYRPWLISTLDSVVEGFFLELASALGVQSTGKNARAAAHKVLQFSKMLTPIKLIPWVEPWGSLVEKVLTAVGEASKARSELADLSLQSRKKDLERNLARINRPIVVIIDDIDRLSPEHVRIVFQMLKAVCDFERVAYLVAYDQEPIKKALSYDGIYDGERYLEKIIQVSYRLPRLSFTHMKDHLWKHLGTLAEQCGINLIETEGALFDFVLNKTDLVRVLESPRDVVRLCNRLRISAPNTRNEVSFADLVAFEALELKFPEVSHIVRTEPDRFVTTARFDEEFASSDNLSAFYRAFAKEEKEGKAEIDGLLQRVNLNERKKDAVNSLLLFLFPRIGGSDYHEKDMPQSINRVRNRDSFLKLLHCGVASFTYSTDQAQRFCSIPDERRNILSEYRDAADLFNWISYVGKVAVDSEIEDPLQLCDVLLEEMAGPESKRTFPSLARHVGYFLYEIIKTRKDGDLRWKMLNRLVSRKISLAVSEYTLVSFLDEFGIWQNGKYVADSAVAKARASVTTRELSIFSYEQLYAAKDQWLASVRDVTSSEDIIQTQKDVLSILYRWGQLNGNDFFEPQSYIMKQSKDDMWLQLYLQIYHTETNVRDMLPFISDDALDFFVERVTSLAQRDEHASTIADFLRQIQAAKAKAEKEHSAS